MTTTEEYFLAIGWYWVDRIGNNKHGWFCGNYHHYSIALPDIRDSFTQLKKWVIDPMEKEGFEPRLGRKKTVGGLYFVWDVSWGKSGPIEELIINGDIPEAMIKSATRYWESKK